MLVKVESKKHEFQRTDDCLNACVAWDAERKEHYLVCGYINGVDHTYPLNEGDKIYFMNEAGKTVDFHRVTNPE